MNALAAQPSVLRGCVGRATGRVIAVRGPVVDVRFDAAGLPPALRAPLAPAAQNVERMQQALSAEETRLRQEEITAEIIELAGSLRGVGRAGAGA